MTRLYANNANSVLASPVLSSDTAIPLRTGDGLLFPSPSDGDDFIAVLTQAGTESSWEEVRVTARSGDSLTVTRGYNGTTAQAWPSGSKCELRVTADAIQNGANALCPDGSGNVTANVLHRTGTLSSLLALAGGSGEISCATDADALVKHNGVAGQAKALYAGGGLVLFNSTAVTNDTIDCSSYSELIINSNGPTAISVIMPNPPVNGQRFTFRTGASNALDCTYTFYTTPEKSVTLETLKIPAYSEITLVYEYSSGLSAWKSVAAFNPQRMRRELLADGIVGTINASSTGLTTDTVTNIGSVLIAPPVTADYGGSISYIAFVTITFTLGTGAVLDFAGVCLGGNGTDFSPAPTKGYATLQGPPANTTDVISLTVMRKIMSPAPVGSTTYINVKARFTGGTVTAAGWGFYIPV